MQKDIQKQVIQDESAVAEWWNVRRAARYLGMSESFVRKSVRLRRIPFTRIGEKAIGISICQSGF
jgi:excisionase family DNA binding protein